MQNEAIRGVGVAESLGGSQKELNALTSDIALEANQTVDISTAQIENQSESGIHENIAARIETVKGNLSHVEDVVNAAYSALNKTKEDINAMDDNIDKYNAVVSTASDIAELLGRGDSEYHALLRNPDLFDLSLEESLLKSSNVTSTYKPETQKGSIESNDFPEEVMDLMDKRVSLVEKGREILKQVVELRNSLKVGV